MVTAATAFTWTVDGVAFNGATSSGASSIVPAINTFASELWECSVVANDDGTDDSSASTVSVSIDSDWGGALTLALVGLLVQPDPTRICVTAATNNGTALAGQVTVTSGYQYWTVPANGDYEITVAGAEGGTNTDHGFIGGYGAEMIGTFTLNAGDVLEIVVGQSGLDGPYNAGGGGGTFVALNCRR